MPPAQVQELVAQVKEWYETHEMLQRDLAEKLGVSPTGLCQIFAGVNNPSASTALAMIRFLEENNMKTNYLDPRTTPRQAAGNPGQPKTLTEARERIEVLEAQLLQLRGAAPKPALTVPPPTVKPKLADASPLFPPITTPGADRLAPTPMPVNVPAVKKAALSEAAVSPVLCQRELDVADFDTVLSMLDNAAAHTPMQQACIYREVKKRRALVANRFQ
jgi:DNA-binding XRE family transcriptional regulator